jgi:histidine triad (HIT) family protein
MEDCIFCKIVSGKIPCYKVYEDDQFLVFLDIYPRVEGHTLVIPKKHYRFVYDVPNFDRYWLVALKITKAMQKVFNPYFITYVTHGLEVPHAHIHILPRKEGETNLVPKVKNITKEKLEEIAKKLLQETQKNQ